MLAKAKELGGIIHSFNFFDTKLSDTVYFEGYYQTEKYFSNFKENILSEFLFQDSIINQKNSFVDKIKKNLSKISSTEVSLNIKEIKKPELNSYLVAENIAQQLVKRIGFRKAMKRAVQSALR